MVDELFPGDGLIVDADVAKALGKHRRSIARWDRNPQFKELGWPPPLYIGGRRHRPLPALRAFMRNAALTHLGRNPAKA